MITSNFNFVFANSFVYLPYSSSTPSFDTLTSEGINVANSTAPKVCSYLASTDDVTYYFYNRGSNKYYCVFISLEQFNVYGNPYSNVYTYNSTEYTLNGITYYRTTVTSPEYSETMVLDSSLCYSTIDEGASAAITFLNTPIVPPTTYNYTLQNGWLSVIDLGASNTAYNLDLSTQFAEYSHLSEPWWNSTQRYWFSNSLPEEDDTFDNDNQGTLISWNKTGKTDIFGRAKSAEANISGTSIARYLYIYNPAYHTFQGLTSANDEANFPMVISGISEGTDIYIYSTTEQYHLTTGPSTTIGNTTATTTATGSALDVTDSFENDGQYIAQNSGGGNDLNNSTGIVGYIMNINNVLDNFTNSIIQLLSAPIAHIQQLVSAGTSFFSVFGQLFTSWLPQEVSSVIISALVVMVVIGVIKMLL